MKKTGVLIFVSALAIGLIFSTNCSFNSFNNLGGIQGSGTAKSETRAVSGFTKVDAGGAVNVEIVTRKDFSVVVETDDNLLANIKTETSGDTLKIYSEDSISPKTPINVKISMPAVEGLDLSGASSGSVSGVKSDALELKASGASKIRIDGATNELTANASGASTIDAESLKTVDANIEASGASRAAVAATGELNVEASGASKVVYVGEPKNLKQNSSGASSVTKK
jgi:hypothetical protein